MKHHLKYKYRPLTLKEAASLTVNDPDPIGWKLHLFNVVDDFRRYPSKRLLAEPPDNSLDTKLSALFTATAWALCVEKKVPVPLWIKQFPPLEIPWFVSGFVSLRAMTLRDCPVYFRQKNVWVMKDFLLRV